MADFIDRNPEQMMKYAAEAKQIIGDMTLIIKKIESVLNDYASDLDDPTQKQIQKLHSCCDSYFKEMAVYQNIAGDIYKKGKQLYDIRNGG